MALPIGSGSLIWGFLIFSVLVFIGSFIGLIFFMLTWRIRPVIHTERGRDSLIGMIRRAKKIKSKSGYALKIMGYKQPVAFHEGCLLPLANKKRGSLIHFYEDDAGDLHPMTVVTELMTSDGKTLNIPAIVPEDVDTKAWAAYEHSRTERILARNGFMQMALPLGLFLITVIGIIALMLFTFKYYSGIAKEFAQTFAPITQAIEQGKLVVAG